MAANHIYRIMFVNQGKVYEVYARNVSHGGLLGFLEVDELVFGERGGVVVDPAEERVKAEFAGVKRSFLPIPAILRIDEVRKQGVTKVTPLEGPLDGPLGGRGSVTPFPGTLFNPPAGDAGPKK